MNKSVVIMGIIGILLVLTSVIWTNLMYSQLNWATILPYDPTRLYQLWNAISGNFILIFIMGIFGSFLLLVPLWYAINPKKFEGIKCIKCGTKNSGDTKYCKNCGAEIAAREATT